MSWDSYIDNLIAHTKDAVGANHCTKAAIIGQDGSKWTTDGHPTALKIAASEASTIGGAFKSKNFEGFQGAGIILEGKKYNFLRVDEEKTIYGKRKGDGGVTLQASKTAVVVGFTPEGKQQGNTNKGVAVIADYLETNNM